MCAKLSPTKIAQAQNAMLYQYIHQLRSIGHKVTATTQTGSALRKFVVDAALKAHKEHQKRIKVLVPVPVNYNSTTVRH